MSAESRAAFESALVDYGKAVQENGLDADASALTAAAQAHLEASRPLTDLLNDYIAADQGSPGAAGTTQEIADELAPVRMAAAVVAGNLPFRAPIVSTEQ